MEHKNWNGFVKGVWQDEINVRDFIQTNYTEYSGDDSFLSGATERTNTVMNINKTFQCYMSSIKAPVIFSLICTRQSLECYTVV